MSNGFQFYEGATTENSTAAKVTVRKGGLLVLTQGAVKMLGDDVEYVQVGYNAETKAIGIRSADEDAKGRYRLRSQNNSLSRLVNGKRFFTHQGLTLEKAHTFEAEDFGDGIVGFTFTEESEGDAPKAAEPEAAPAKGKPAAKGKAAGGRKSRAAA